MHHMHHLHHRHPDPYRETRIMRDDVLSYGGFATVSAITLAAMEDLGYYKANYSGAGCLAWGRMQGCALSLHPSSPAS